MTAELISRRQRESAERESPWGLMSWVASVDHKRVGIMYLLLATFFLVIGGGEAILIRIQLAVPNNTFLSPQLFNQLFTMHGTTMVFLVGMPMFSGFANYLVPLMIGARDVAFPRLNAMSFWMLPFGGMLLYFSFLTGSAPDAGWFAYAPLSTKAYSSLPGVDCWILGIAVMGIGSVAGAINIVATVLCCRAPGMSLQRVPLFVWIMLMQSLLIIITIPPLNAAISLLLIDRSLDAAFFQPCAWRLGSVVAALLLDVRSPGSVRLCPARLCDDLRSDSGVFAKADLWLRVRRGVVIGDRVAQLWRLGPSHVRRRVGTECEHFLRDRDPADRHSDGHQGFQLDGDVMGWVHSVHRGDAVFGRVSDPVRVGGLTGIMVCRGADRLAINRHLLCRRAFPLCVDRRNRFRAVCGNVLLVP